MNSQTNNINENTKKIKNTKKVSFRDELENESIASYKKIDQTKPVSEKKYKNIEDMNDEEFSEFIFDWLNLISLD